MSLGSEVHRTQTSDPLSVHVPLPHRSSVFPYGFPVQISSNAPEVVRLAELAWGHWKPRFDTKPLELRCVIADGGHSPKVLREPIYRAQRNLLTITGDSTTGATCDLSTGFAFAWTTQSVLAEPDYFRYFFLEAAVYGLLENLHLLSIHAACVMRNGRGVLLAGDSGAGKTSLSYACALRGWSYISDDASVVVRRLRNGTVLGESGRFRFRDNAGIIFPEFQGLRSSPRFPGNGKPTVEVRTESLPNIRTAQETQVKAIVFLRRHDDVSQPVRLIAFHDRIVAAKRLFHHAWPDELPAHQERLDALQGLLAVNLFELQYRGLDEAVNALDSLTDESV